MASHPSSHPILSCALKSSSSRLIESSIGEFAFWVTGPDWDTCTKQLVVSLSTSVTSAHFFCNVSMILLYTCLSYLHELPASPVAKLRLAKCCTRCPPTGLWSCTTPPGCSTTQECSAMNFTQHVGSLWYTSERGRPGHIKAGHGHRGKSRAGSRLMSLHDATPSSRGLH